MAAPVEAGVVIDFGRSNNNSPGIIIIPSRQQGWDYPPRYRKGWSHRPPKIDVTSIISFTIAFTIRVTEALDHAIGMVDTTIHVVAIFNSASAFKQTWIAIELTFS